MKPSVRPSIRRFGRNTARPFHGESFLISTKDQHFLPVFKGLAEDQTGWIS
jgi:hypothetical protein